MSKQWKRAALWVYCHIPGASSKAAIKYPLYYLHILPPSSSDEEHYKAGSDIWLAKILQRSHIKLFVCIYVYVCVCVCIRIWEEWIEIVTNSNNLPFHILLLVTCQHSFLIFSSFIGQFLFNHYMGNASCTNEKWRKGCSRHPAGQIKTTYAAGLSCYSRAQARGLLIWSYCFVDCRVGKKHENTYQDKMFLPLLIT